MRPITYKEYGVKALEDWFLDSFMPWLKYVGMYIGILAIEAGVAYSLEMLFGWDFFKTFIGVFIVGGLLVVELKSRRLSRRIKSLMKEEMPNMELIIRDNHFDRDAENRVINRIVTILKKEGFEEHEKGGIASEVKKSVFEYARREKNMKDLLEKDSREG